MFCLQVSDAQRHECPLVGFVSQAFFQAGVFRPDGLDPFIEPLFQAGFPVILLRDC
jgi:hypothetical protein